MLLLIFGKIHALSLPIKMVLNALINSWRPTEGKLIMLVFRAT